jgi:Tol biopolymer transport system component
MRAHRSRLVTGLALTVGTAMFAPPAHATFPGRNGKLVVAVEGCGKFHSIDAPRFIRAYSPSGRNLGRLTGCDTDRSQPEWSPNGRRLALVEGHRKPHIVTIAANGSHHRRVRAAGQLASAPSFAPGGRRFVFAAGADGDALSIVNLVRGTVRRLFANPCPDSCSYFDPRWSPRGRSIAVERVHAGTSEIDLVRARTGKQIPFLAFGRDADWSPSGRRLVYTSNFHRTDTNAVTGANLYVVGANGKGRRRLVRTHDVAAVQPTWSPNGRFIAYVQLEFGAGQPPSTIKASLWRVRVKGGRPHQIAKLPAVAVGQDYRTPSLSWQPLPR